MEKFNKSIPFSHLNDLSARLKKCVNTFMLLGIFMVFSASGYAANIVKPLSNKALKKIEEKYDKQTRDMFSGKGSEKNVLALKRLIAEEVNPDLAIAAIKKYDQAKKYRSGTTEKREAFEEIEALFANSNISSKEGRDIIIGAGGAVRARKTKTVQTTYQKANKPSCSNKITSTKRAPKMKYQDSDRLAESVLLKELKGETGDKVSEAIS